MEHLNLNKPDLEQFTNQDIKKFDIKFEKFGYSVPPQFPPDSVTTFSNSEVNICIYNLYN